MYVKSKPKTAVVSATVAGLGTIGAAAGFGAATTAGAITAGSTIVGTAAGVIGTGVSSYSTMAQAAVSERAEALRRRQMRLDARRQQRQIIRQMQIQRGQAINTQAAVGGELAGSSVTAGIDAATTGTGSIQLGETQTALEYGEQMFNLNRRTSSIQGISTIGTGLARMGQGIAQGGESLGRLGATEAGLQIPR